MNKQESETESEENAHIKYSSIGVTLESDGNKPHNSLDLNRDFLGEGNRRKSDILTTTTTASGFCTGTYQCCNLGIK